MTEVRTEIPTIPQTQTRPFTGDEYLQSLCDGRSVWIYGERVDDVTTHPAFRNQVRMTARLYDALHRDATLPVEDRVLTCATDGSADRFTHPFFKASHTAAELVAARDAIAAWQRIGYGWMGRSPDFMASLLGMLGSNAELYAPYQENAHRWYQRAQTQVPYVNHALANPPVDRRLPPDEVDDLYVHVVKETDAGLIVSGAKTITTNAALTQYSFVGSDGGSFIKDKQMAALFFTPMNAPGIKVICRPSYEMTAGVMGTPFDYPLSSRFDENDAIFILDNVLIPWENVLVYGDTTKHNNHMNSAGIYHRMGLQACTRLAVKLDFIVGLLLKAVEATGVDQFRGVQVNLGEVVTWRHLFWSLSDAMCHAVTHHNGAVIPKLEHFMSYRMLMAQAYPRVKEIVHQLVASGLIYHPSSTRDFHSEELRPYLDKYVRSSDGGAVDRTKLMKTLWDAVGTEFGGRHELYERNHSGNHEAMRLHPFFHGLASGTIEQMKGLAEQCLAEVDLNGWTTPDLITPDDISFFNREAPHTPLFTPKNGSTNGRSTNGRTESRTNGHSTNHVAGNPATPHNVATQYTTPMATPSEEQIVEPQSTESATTKSAITLDLPLDYPRRAAEGPLQRRQVLLSPELLTQLRDVSESTQTSFAAIFLGTLQLLLHRYTGQDTIPIGVMHHLSDQHVPLTGTLLQTTLSSLATTGLATTSDEVAPTFVNLLRQSQQQLDTFITMDSPPPLSLTPQVLLLLQDAANGMNGAAHNTVALSAAELQVEATDLAGALQLTLAYRTDLWEPITIDRAIGHLQTLLTAIAMDPTQPITQLPLLTATEQEQLTVTWTATALPFPADQGIHQLFEAQVARTPDAVALTFNGDEERNLSPETLTYRELNARSNQLARYLQSLGIGKAEGAESLVGLCVERSPEMVIGVLGILKAGGAYVPLDPNYPQDRVAFMLQDANTSVLLTQHHLQATLPLADTTAQVLYLDSDWPKITQCDDHNPEGQTDPNRLAYVLYTSGSTGRPKGVMIEHRSPAALIAWAQSVYKPTELAGVLASTSICFDLSVYELFLPLSVGGKIILAENALHLPTLIHKDQVTLINTVPSSIEELLRQQGIPASVQTVNLAGEPLRQALVEKLYAQPTIQRVYDLYGPSEDTTYSTFTLREAGGTANIGKPIANTQAYILDPNLQLLPVGIAGELHLGGAGLARGYLNQPTLTTEKFIANPFGSAAKPGRLYKTGDLVRWLPDGRIEYLGRIDHQVKIRGFRIELGEIEAVLGHHSAIQEVVVVARPQQHVAGQDDDGQGAKELVAYLAAHPQATALTPSELRDYLAQTLPHYMLPARFVWLDALPRTPNGKVDRKALPAPAIEATAEPASLTLPGTPIEEVITQIWCEVLNRKQVGVDEKFMDLGGHSLQAMQVIAKIGSIFQVQFPLSRIIEAPTVAALAQLVEEYEGKPGQATKLARLQLRLAQLDN